MHKGPRSAKARQSEIRTSPNRALIRLQKRNPLESKGIFVSTGSACSSNKKGKSHVLSAIGCSEKEIESAIRFSISGYNTPEEIDITIEKTKAAVAGFRKLGSAVDRKSVV